MHARLSRPVAAHCASCMRLQETRTGKIGHNVVQLHKLWDAVQAVGGYNAVGLPVMQLLTLPAASAACPELLTCRPLRARRGPRLRAASAPSEPSSAAVALRSQMPASARVCVHAAGATPPCRLTPGSSTCSAFCPWRRCTPLDTALRSVLPCPWPVDVLLFGALPCLLQCVRCAGAEGLGGRGSGDV